MKSHRSEGNTQISISIQKALLAEIDALAAKDDRKRAPWIVIRLKEYIANQKAKETQKDPAASRSKHRSPITKKQPKVNLSSADLELNR